MNYFRRHWQGRFDREKGTALVEFALVLPLFLLIVFGIVDFGRALNFWDDQTHLANEAARYASVNSNAPCPAGATDPCLNAALVAQSVDPTAVSLSICYPDVVVGGVPQTQNAPVVGNPVHVTVRDNYQWLFKFPLNFLGINWNPTNVTITAGAEMRIEQASNSHYAVTSWNSTTNQCN